MGTQWVHGELPLPLLWDCMPVDIPEASAGSFNPCRGLELRYPPVLQLSLPSSLDWEGKWADLHLLKSLLCWDLLSSAGAEDFY